MLKKSSSFVLARHSRLTISTAFTNVPHLIRRVADLPAALPEERRVSARRGLAGEIVGRFEHPAGYSGWDETDHS
jgi:hypothetical protein